MARRAGFIYVGNHARVWFWELVVTVNKLVIAVAVVTLTPFGAVVQVRRCTCGALGMTTCPVLTLHDVSHHRWRCRL